MKGYETSSRKAAMLLELLKHVPGSGAAPGASPRAPSQTSNGGNDLEQGEARASRGQ